MIRARVVAAAALVVLGTGACGGNAASAGSGGTVSAAAHQTTQAPTRTVSVARPKQLAPSRPRVLSDALGAGPTAGFVPAVSWRGRPAAWIARTGSGVTMLEFDQRVLGLHLHAGSADEGATGWRFGASLTPGERRRVVAAFNGGFKFSTNPGGFESFGRVAVPLRDGLGSVVTYADGRTDVGSWHQEVPAAGNAVVSVRQNLALLIDHGRGATSSGCVSCWGATLGGVLDPARSALGIASNGRLVWAGGEHLTVAGLVDALLAARVVRAVELDINPEWVAAYLYEHRDAHGPPGPVPALAGQPGIPGQFLAPWSRDFFTVIAK